MFYAVVLPVDSRLVDEKSLFCPPRFCLSGYAQTGSYTKNLISMFVLCFFALS
jgi:hypothetical protein